jgi:dienelactone hydrolase
VAERVDWADIENFPITFHQVRDQWKTVVHTQSLRYIQHGNELRASLSTPEEWSCWQANARKIFLECIGGLPESNAALDARLLKVSEIAGLQVESVVFQSRPGIWVTTNIYVPQGSSGRLPALLFLCGHHSDAKSNTEYQEACQLLAHAGFVVMIIDPIGQGERLQYVRGGNSVYGAGIFEHDQAGSQCLPLGDSLARYMLHDAVRAVDYLSGRPDVDPQRIGVTGNSGGGTQTTMLMMAEPRIAAAAPATCIMSHAAYMNVGRARDAEQIWPSFTRYGLDHADLLATMAPRPVLVLAAEYDFFPIEGTRDSVQRARPAWKALGGVERLELYEERTTHRYSAAMAYAAADFFCRHLKGQAVPSLTKKSPEILPVEMIRCTTEGQLLLESKAYGGIRTIHDEIVARLEEVRDNRPLLSLDDKREWLRTIVYRDRTPCPLNPRLYVQQATVGDMQMYSGLWWSQTGIFNHGCMFRNEAFAAGRLPLTIAIWSGGTSELSKHQSWLENECRNGQAVLVLDTTGVGPLQPHPIGNRDSLALYGIQHKMACDLHWIGDSIPAIRAYDVLRALDLSRELPGIDHTHLRLYGDGLQY